MLAPGLVYEPSCVTGPWAYFKTSAETYCRATVTLNTLGEKRLKDLKTACYITATGVPVCLKWSFIITLFMYYVVNVRNNVSVF